MSPEFRAIECGSCPLTICCECGCDADAYAELVETGEFLCKTCCDKDAEQ